MLLLGAAGMLVLGLIGFVWTRLASVLLVVLSVFWVYADVRPEGPVLWRVTSDHGLVLADVWGLLGLLAGVFLLVRGPARPPR